MHCEVLCGICVPLLHGPIIAADVMEYYLSSTALSKPSEFLDLYSNPPPVVLDSGELIL